MSTVLIDTQSIREEILNTPRKQEDVPTPWWPRSDGHIALRDVPTDEILALESVKNKSQGLYVAALLIKALINKDTGDPIFADADREAVSKLGLTTLNPIFEQVQTFFGIGNKTAVADAKKN